MRARKIHSSNTVGCIDVQAIVTHSHLSFSWAIWTWTLDNGHHVRKILLICFTNTTDMWSRWARWLSLSHQWAAAIACYNIKLIFNAATFSLPKTTSFVASFIFGMMYTKCAEFLLFKNWQFKRRLFLNTIAKGNLQYTNGKNSLARNFFWNLKNEKWQNHLKKKVFGVTTLGWFV